MPDRNGEYPQGGQGSYVGTADCQNPLFAAVLPDGSDTTMNALCHAPPGTQRAKDMVFYAHIGGVPNQLLHFTPGNPGASLLTPADWVKILGKDPDNLDYTGIDPHMIESQQPRPNVAPPGSPNGTDPINGHDWVTDTGIGHTLQVDLQYACTFDLVDATGTPAPRDCTLMQNQNACDCPHTAGSVNAMQLPPICDQTTITKQTGAKAYPTIRELLLAKKMGTQGIVSSICPQHVAEMAPGDPLYGYRPAVAAIVDRLKDALTNQCLPVKLPLDQRTREVLCRILLQMPASTGGTCLNPACDPVLGLAKPDPQVLSPFCQSLEDQYNQQGTQSGGNVAGLIDPANVSVCELQQLTAAAGNPSDFQGGTCANAPDKGWCYVTGAAAGYCSQAVVFSPKSIPSGATARLVCQ